MVRWMIYGCGRCFWMSYVTYVHKYMSLWPSRNMALKLLHSKDVMMGWDSDTTGAALGSLVASTQIFVGKSFRLRRTKSSFLKKG